MTTMKQLYDRLELERFFQDHIDKPVSEECCYASSEQRACQDLFMQMQHHNRENWDKGLRQRAKATKAYLEAGHQPNSLSMQQRRDCQDHLLMCLGRIAGHQQVKNNLITTLPGKIAQGFVPSTMCLGLQGPPGCGKTTLALAVAKAWQKVIAYQYPNSCAEHTLLHASFGQAEDATWLLGSVCTYTHAAVGAVARHMALAKCRALVCVLDEVDKGNAREQSALAAMLDPNSQFHDDFIEMRVDLRQVYLVVTYNDKRALSDFLASRLLPSTWEVEPLGDADKVQLVQKNLFEHCQSTTSPFLHLRLQASCATLAERMVKDMVDRDLDIGMRTLMNKVHRFGQHYRLLAGDDDNITEDKPLTMDLLTHQIFLWPPPRDGHNVFDFYFTSNAPNDWHGYCNFPEIAWEQYKLYPYLLASEDSPCLGIKLKFDKNQIDLQKSLQIDCQVKKSFLALQLDPLQAQSGLAQAIGIFSESKCLSYKTICRQVDCHFSLPKEPLAFLRADGSSDEIWPRHAVLHVQLSLTAVSHSQPIHIEAKPEEKSFELSRNARWAIGTGLLGGLTLLGVGVLLAPIPVGLAINTVFIGTGVTALLLKSQIPKTVTCATQSLLNLAMFPRSRIRQLENSVTDIVPMCR